MWKLSGAAVALIVCSSPVAHAAPQAGLPGFYGLYVVCDDAIVRAAASSSYLREFGGLVVKESKSSEGHFRSLFLFGEHSEFEMLAPGDVDLDHAVTTGPGRTGIELVTDQVGGLERFKAAIAPTGTRLRIQTQHKPVEGHDVEWFTAAEPAALPEDAQAAPPGFETEAIEFAASFLDNPGTHKAPSRGPGDTVARARYLRDLHNPAQPMRDIAGATFALTRERWQIVRPMYVAAGFRVQDTATGARAVGDATLEFVFAPEAHGGLRRVEFELRKAPSAPHTEQLGRSVLVVGPGPHAVWTFDAR